MSLPRPVVAGETIMIARRCTQGQFLLRPSSAVNGVIGYCLAVAAERYGLRRHAFRATSNHLHIVATDLRGEAPECCRWLFEFTARCLNARWGRWENLWACEHRLRFVVDPGPQAHGLALYGREAPLNREPIDGGSGPIELRLEPLPSPPLRSAAQLVE